MTTTHIVRVTLDDETPIYRDIEIAGGKSLYALAEGIVGAFGFDFDHAFGFYSGLTERTMMEARPRYELLADMGGESDAKSVKKTAVAQAFPELGHAMMFLFDCGDEWLFRAESSVSAKRWPERGTRRLPPLEPNTHNKGINGGNGHGPLPW